MSSRDGIPVEVVIVEEEEDGEARVPMGRAGCLELDLRLKEDIDES
jgi:hypothetical protein